MLGLFDVSLFRWINLHWSSPVLDELFRFLSVGTKLNSVRIGLLALVAAMIIRGGRARVAACLAMLSWPVANAICDVCKNTFPALRPCVQLDGVRVLTDYAGKSMYLDSFGTLSAHSANMAAVAMAMCLTTRWWGLPWVIVALLTGLSRIYVGVHYPSQVLLGWLAGAVTGWVAVKTYEAFKAALLAKRDLEDSTADG